MLEPRYLFTGDFARWHDILAKEVPCEECRFEAGDQIWKLGDYIRSVYYIERGVVKTSVAHEDGHAKVLYFTGRDQVYPGCHESQFNIEKSMTTGAVTRVRALRFDRAAFRAFALRTPGFMADLLELYASWINLHIYESAHQEYNTAFERLCNLLLLLAEDAGAQGRIDISQQDIAGILANERESVTRYLGRLRKEGIVETHRGWLQVRDFDGLLSYCSDETLAL